MDNTQILKQKRSWKNRHKDLCDCAACETRRLDQHSFPSVLVIIGVIVMLGMTLFSSCRVAHASNIVKIAQMEIGKGETVKNNYGKEVFKYTNGQAVPWCAAFVSWTLKKAGKNSPYLLSAKNYLKVGKRVTRPQVGDLIVFNRKAGGHIGIIESISEEKITTIEGNVGKYPAKVKRVKYNAENIPNFVGFVRV